MFPGQHRVDQHAHLGVGEAHRNHVAHQVQPLQPVLQVFRSSAQLGLGAREHDLDHDETPRIELLENRLVLHFVGEVRDAVHRGAQVRFGGLDFGGVVIVVQPYRRIGGVVGNDGREIVDSVQAL